MTSYIDRHERIAEIIWRDGRLTVSWGNWNIVYAFVWGDGQRPVGAVWGELRGRWFRRLYWDN